MSNDQQQYPYGQEPHGQDRYGQPQQVPQPQQAPYDPSQAPQAPQVPQEWNETHGSAQGQHGQQGPGDAAQTWEGQTWDTQYQPHVGQRGAPGPQAPGRPAPYPAQAPYSPQAPYPARHAQPARHAAPAPAAAAADTAYPQPQGGGHPLPPEARDLTPGQAPVAGPPVPGLPGPADSGHAFEAPGGVGSASYNPPTTLGNARITDAQRARAEGRSPIIAPGMQPAGLTALLGLLLAGGAAVGPYALLVPLILLQAVTAAGWFRLNGMWPARQGIALAFLGGLVSDVVLLVVGKENALPAIIGTLGVWVLLTLVLQLRSHAGADERMQGLMATVASAALAILATGHLAAVPDAVVVGGVAVAAATLARALPLPGAVSVVVALLVAAGAGVAAGGFTDLGTGGALLGLGAGVCALVGLRAASYDYPSRFVHMTAGVALPLTAAAPAVYLLGRALA